MFRKTLAPAVGALSLLAAGAACAGASESDTYTLTLTGFVPTVCNATLGDNAVATTEGLISLGQMNEFCNDSNGYQVWVQYSPSLAGDTLTVGDQQIVLDDSGSVMIDSASGPASTKKSVSLVVPEAGVSGTLSVRVVSL